MVSISVIMPPTPNCYKLLGYAVEYCKFDVLRTGGSILNHQYSKTCVKQPLSKRPKNVFKDRILLNAGQKYCRMLQKGAFCNIFDLH